MRTKLPFLIVSLILLLTSGCSQKNPSQPAPGHATPEAKLVDFVGCKTDKQFTSTEGTPSDMDCVEYEYNSDNLLQLSHINAGFNCCPGEISADISIENDTITIIERESDPNCHCLCLFDIDYEIENITPAKYTIKIVELYLDQDDEKIEFTVDLSSPNSGSECFPRDHYPWNTGYPADEPTGNLIDYSGCKGPTTQILDIEVPGELDCVVCLYSDTGILSLKHINAGFNCCLVEAITDINISNDTITITEDENSPPCDCLCLFDLEYEISNIEPGNYTIIIRELYVHEDDELLQFDIELPCLPNYSYCVPRTHYPWKTNYSEEEDLRRLSEMGEIIDELQGTPYCNSTDDCIALPHGSKPCGGPCKYIAASKASEDFGLLVFHLCIYNCFQDLLNNRYNYDSDCAFVTKPDVICRKGICTLEE